MYAFPFCHSCINTFSFEKEKKIAFLHYNYKLCMHERWFSECWNVWKTWTLLRLFLNKDFRLRVALVTKIFYRLENHHLHQCNNNKNLKIAIIPYIVLRLHLHESQQHGYVSSWATTQSSPHIIINLLNFRLKFSQMWEQPTAMNEFSFILLSLVRVVYFRVQFNSYFL